MSGLQQQPCAVEVEERSDLVLRQHRIERGGGPRILLQTGGAGLRVQRPGVIRVGGDRLVGGLERVVVLRLKVEQLGLDGEQPGLERGGEVGGGQLSHQVLRVLGAQVSQRLAQRGVDPGEEVLRVRRERLVERVLRLGKQPFREVRLAEADGVRRILPRLVGGRDEAAARELQISLRLQRERLGEEQPGARAALPAQLFDVVLAFLHFAFSDHLQRSAGVTVFAVPVVSLLGLREPFFRLRLFARHFVRRPQLGVKGTGEADRVGRGGIERQDLVRLLQRQVQIYRVVLDRDQPGLAHPLAGLFLHRLALVEEVDRAREQRGHQADLENGRAEALLLLPVADILGLVHRH